MAPVVLPAILCPRACVGARVVAVDSDLVCAELLEPFSEKPES